MDPLDKLLAELKAEYEDPKPKQQFNSEQPVSPQQSKSASLIDNVLEQVKTDFEQQDLALELQKQQQLEQLRATKLEALKKQANDWLANLDSLSPEGLWFERFAEGYSSRLEAAIEYLQAGIMNYEL